MTDAETQVKTTGAPPDEAHKLKLVTVTVDCVEKQVAAGTYIVAAFKQLVGVDGSRELDEVIHGEFRPLADNASIEIKQGERFVSHVRTGSSS